MICNLCKGARNFLIFSPLEYYDCPKCGGAGVSIQHGPAVINSRFRRQALKETNHG